jgi:hypothetical protein
LNWEAKVAWQASKANPVAITKKQRSKLLHAFHPDKKVSAERKKELNDALQIFNALKWRVIMVRTLNRLITAGQTRKGQCYQLWRNLTRMSQKWGGTAPRHATDSAARPGGRARANRSKNLKTTKNA